MTGNKKTPFGPNDRRQFVRDFITTFLASWCAENYSDYCTGGRQKELSNPPVEDAEHLANEAFNKIRDVIGLAFPRADSPIEVSSQPKLRLLTIEQDPTPEDDDQLLDVIQVGSRAALQNLIGELNAALANWPDEVAK